MSVYPYEGWRNKGGTDDRNAPCGSWKAYWQSQTNQPWPEFCCVKGCSNKATDGAHMYCPSVDMREWIIPTCHSCNMQRDSVFTLDFNLPSELISANVKYRK